MIKDFKKHVAYYISIIFVFGIGIALFYKTAYDRGLQLEILFLMVLFYVVYGIAHHFANHDLSIKIVVEYLLMGGLGASLVLFFLKGGI